MNRKDVFDKRNILNEVHLSYEKMLDFKKFTNATIKREATFFEDYNREYLHNSKEFEFWNFTKIRRSFISPKL
jgi:hypothetical protein